MRILPVDETGLASALEVLREGGVVAHATETCYGLACDLTNPAAVTKLFAIKQRPLTQPVSALFPSVEDAKRYVEWTAHAEELARLHLPGPLTMILPLRADAPGLLLPTLAGGATVGMRVSSHPVAEALAVTFASPLSTSSANVHGLPSPYTAAEIIAQFAGRPDHPDLLLDSGTLPPVPPSTIVDLTGGAPATVRKGPIERK
jgi:L-threonylcarbamoyladenylate synthase